MNFVILEKSIPVKAYVRVRGGRMERVRRFERTGNRKTAFVHGTLVSRIDSIMKSGLLKKYGGFRESELGDPNYGGVKTFGVYLAPYNSRGVVLSKWVAITSALLQGEINVAILKIGILKGKLVSDPEAVGSFLYMDNIPASRIQSVRHYRIKSSIVKEYKSSLKEEYSGPIGPDWRGVQRMLVDILERKDLSLDEVLEDISDEELKKSSSYVSFIVGDGAIRRLKRFRKNESRVEEN